MGKYHVDIFHQSPPKADIGTSNHILGRCFIEEICSGEIMNVFQEYGFDCPYLASSLATVRSDKCKVFLFNNLFMDIHFNLCDNLNLLFLEIVPNKEKFHVFLT